MATIEMFDNIQQILQFKQQLMSDPVGTLAKNKYNVPQGMTNPAEITQYLLNTGQITQTQVNNAMKMRNNPLIQKLFGGR